MKQEILVKQGKLVKKINPLKKCALNPTSFHNTNACTNDNCLPLRDDDDLKKYIKSSLKVVLVYFSLFCFGFHFRQHTSDNLKRRKNVVEEKKYDITRQGHIECHGLIAIAGVLSRSPYKAQRGEKVWRHYAICYRNSSCIALFFYIHCTLIE